MSKRPMTPREQLQWLRENAMFACSWCGVEWFATDLLLLDGEPCCATCKQEMNVQDDLPAFDPFAVLEKALDQRDAVIDSLAMQARSTRGTP